MSSPGGGELSLFACPGVGNRPPSENKIANPRGYARGGGWLHVELNHALLLGKWGESWPNIHVSVMLLVKARLGFALAQNKDLAQLDLI